MSSVSNVSSFGNNGYIAPATGASSSASKKPGPAVSQASITSLSNSSSSPLTYNSAGLLVSSQQAAPGASSSTPVTSAQATQNAALTANLSVAQTLSSLFSSLSSNANSSSIFSLPGTPSPSTSSTTTATQTAQNAVLTAEQTVNQTLNSLFSSSSQNSSSSNISSILVPSGASSTDTSPVTTSAQTAKNAVISANQAVTNTLGSLG